jgi:hypothetical protein
MRIDYDRLYAMADRRRGEFRTARPFPHIVIDDLLDPETYGQVRAAFPPPDSPIWKKPENAHTRGKLVTRRGESDLKERLYSEAARRVFFELNCGLFLRFLDRLTGIPGLVGDPYFAEAGFHCSESGGFLDIHADFSHHDFLGLERRLNLLLYVNDGWKEEYGGALSLYDLDLRPVRSVLPVANRCVLFETSETSYHGHPEPMRMPADVYRKSIALYYYSLPTGRRKSKIVFPTDRAFVPTVTRE